MKNIAENLKNAPKGLKLYSPVFGEVEFLEVPEKESLVDGKVKIKDVNGCIHYFDECGRYSNIGDCVLFPSKEHQTWNNWRVVIIPKCVGKVLTMPYYLKCDYKWIITKEGIFAVNNENNSFTKFLTFEEFNLKCELYFATLEETEQCFNELERQGYKFVDGEVVEVVEKSVNYSGKWVVLAKSMSGVQSRDGAFLDLDEGDVFFCEGMSMFGLCNVVHERSEREFHIKPSLLREWTIEDAKDGDVMVASDGSIFIFKEVVDCGCKHYIALTKDDETINVNDSLEHFWETARGVKPATKEQRDLLFSKMKEAGYEWDSDKKIISETEKNFTINDLKPFDKVLVRDSDDDAWSTNWFSYYYDNVRKQYMYHCQQYGYNQCVPYNSETEHLLGTTKNYDGPYKTW